MVSRIFCQKSVRVIFRNFRTVLSIVRTTLWKVDNVFDTQIFCEINFWAIFLQYILNFYAEFRQVVIKFVNVGKSNEVFSEKEISSHHHESFVLTENWQCIGIKRRVGRRCLQKLKSSGLKLGFDDFHGIPFHGKYHKLMWHFLTEVDAFVHI